MTTRKRNEYLDIGGSEEEEELVQNSEGEQDARNSRLNGLSSPSAKRRKFSNLDPAASDDSEADEDETGTPKVQSKIQTDNGATNTTADPSLSQNSTTRPRNSNLKPLTASQLASSQRAAKKTGVIYLSRIPPFMRPSTLRTLLTPYGPTARLFLTPEPPASYARRVKSGGNKKRSFVDGWVEFVSKQDAKICAETLNGQIIGGKKGGWYHDDLWNIKYLRGFKWGDLMAQVVQEEKGREGRIRAEVAREGRERKAFLGGVERAKVERGMREKRKRKEELMKEEGKGKDAGDGDPGAPGYEATVRTKKDEEKEKGNTGNRQGREWRFRQNEVKAKTATERSLQEQPDDVKRVLSKIF
ncbi:RNA-binding ATPase activator esf2 [Ptychographa xylographoides]|nr:RNA-binding ATPase activator esf2 [Ptychographa xylographoides]